MCKFTISLQNPSFRDKIIQQIEGKLYDHCSYGNSRSAKVTYLEREGSNLVLRFTINHKHIWNNFLGKKVTLYDATTLGELKFNPFNSEELENSKVCIELPQKNVAGLGSIGGGTFCLTARQIAQIVSGIG